MRTVGLWTFAVGIAVVVLGFASGASVTLGLLVVVAGLVLATIGSLGRGTGRSKPPSGPMQATMHDVDPQWGTITSDRGWDFPRT
jgi:hypothetical protein